MDEKEWKEKLTPEQYRVLREKGTEMAYTGEYYKHDEVGMYSCAGCGTELFDSSRKFDAHCGWPSFDQAKEGAVEFHEDNSHGMQRTEVTCASCGGHLGHVFPDGPQETTGQRFCINSVALGFEKGKE